tara:strand:- start:615 stop:791 length:177 start_codon:yes stop_codon:yes gene_type:complete
VSKRYELQKRRISYFTLTVYADSPEEALELAENGRYDDDHFEATEYEIDKSMIEEVES